MSKFACEFVSEGTCASFPCPGSLLSPDLVECPVRIIGGEDS